MKTLKFGTRIEVQGYDMAGNPTWEPATIRRVMAYMRPVPEGYHPVRFADGGGLMVHESGFRVVDNRATIALARWYSRSAQTDHLKAEADRQAIPLRTVVQVRQSIDRARKYGTEKQFAQLLLSHGRITDDAREWLEGVAK